MNYLGNTHGSLIKIKDDYYVFYHRQTNRHCHSRQACAERIIRNPDGTFSQAELTSCGLNGGPLKGEGKYPAYIACHLYKRGEPKFLTAKIAKGHHPYFTQTGKDREERGDQYVANFGDDCVLGFKYFDFTKDEIEVSLLLSGKPQGTLRIKDSPDGKELGTIALHPTSGKEAFHAKVTIGTGIKALYFDFVGSGRFDIFELEIQ